MSIFRDLVLFEKIASANTFTVTGLCHDIDHPVIELLVDEVFSVPKAFGEAILTRNNQYIASLNNAAIGVKNTLRIVHEKIEGSLLNTNQLTLGELSKAIHLRVIVCRSQSYPIAGKARQSKWWGIIPVSIAPRLGACQFDRGLCLAGCQARVK